MLFSTHCFSQVWKQWLTLVNYTSLVNVSIELTPDWFLTSWHVLKPIVIHNLQGHQQACTYWMVQTYWQSTLPVQLLLIFTSNSNGNSCAVCCSHSAVGLAFVCEDSTAWQHPDPLSWTACAQNSVISKQLIVVHVWITTSTNWASEVQIASKTGLVSSGICWQLYILWFDWKKNKGGKLKPSKRLSDKYYM